MTRQFHVRAGIEAGFLIVTKELTFTSEEQRDRFRIAASNHGIRILAVWHDDAYTCQEAIEACLIEGACSKVEVI